MNPKPSRSAVLILNHFLDRALVDQYAELRRDCGATRDVFLLSDRTQVSLSSARLPRDAQEIAFTTRALVELGYPGKSAPIQARRGARNMTLGNADLPLLLFFRQYPHYEHYWLVEYDVRYSGKWESLFSAFDPSGAALVGSTLQRRDQCPRWSHWSSLRLPGVEMEPTRWIRGFFPVYRMTRRALTELDQAYQGGCAGHMEAVVPTVLAAQGLEIEDMGGQGEFVRHGNENRFYENQPHTNELSPGTFVYRPVLTRYGDRPDTLWHPVKARRPKWRSASKRILGRAATYFRDQLATRAP